MSEEEQQQYGGNDDNSQNYGGDDGGNDGGNENYDGGQTENYDPEPEPEYDEPENPVEPEPEYEQPEDPVEPEPESAEEPYEEQRENPDEPGEPEQRDDGQNDDGESGEPEDTQLSDDNCNGDAEQSDNEPQEQPELPEATVDDEEIDDVPLEPEELDNFVADFSNEDEDLQVLLNGDDESSRRNETYPDWDMAEEDSYMQMNLDGSAFPGLVGNTNCDFFNAYSPQPQYYGNSSFSNKSYGGHQGQKKFGKMDLAKMLFSVGKTVYSHMKQNKAGGDSGSGKGLIGKIFKGIIGGGKGNARGQPAIGASTGSGFGGISNIFGGLAEGKGIGTVIGGLIAGSGGFGNRGTSGQYAGGGNISQSSLDGGLIDKIGVFIGDKLHKYFGVDPATGRIFGAVAGNVIFRLAGKDNKLGNIGKVILDNIVTGKYKRNVDPYVPADSDWKVQDFHALRDECLKNKRLFEDPYFLANEQSLFYSQRPPKSVEWLRPAAISKRPQLFVEGHSRFDVVQGELGDCWLLAATANLTLRDELFYRVVPPDQSFTENYAGIFHFQFWRYGKWVDVVVDDRLPCHNGNLLYLHSSNNNEFWSALLEKALYGSYEALKGGNTCEALCDFTGGLTEFIDLKDQPANLMQMMFKSFECGSLMGCSIEADPQSFEAKLPNGLVRGHAYSITGMKIV